NKTYDALTKDVEAGDAQRISPKQADENSAVADIAAIEGYLAVGNLEEAALQANLGLLASPGHPHLAKLESDIREKIERTGEFQRLMNEAKQHCGRRQWESAIQSYQAARNLDPENTTARLQMARAYADWARDLLPVDRKAAEKLVETSLSLDPDNPE